MDSYLWYTHTIHQEAHDRLHNRSHEVRDSWRVQPSPVDHVPQRRRLRLTLGKLLIAAGVRLQVEEAAVHEHG